MVWVREEKDLIREVYCRDEAAPRSDVNIPERMSTSGDAKESFVEARVDPHEADVKGGVPNVSK